MAKYYFTYSGSIPNSVSRSLGGEWDYVRTSIMGENIEVSVEMTGRDGLEGDIYKGLKLLADELGPNRVNFSFTHQIDTFRRRHEVLPGEMETKITSAIGQINNKD